MGSLSALGNLASLSVSFRDFLVSLDKFCFCILLVHPSHRDNDPLFLSLSNSWGRAPLFQCCNVQTCFGSFVGTSKCYWNANDKEVYEEWRESNARHKKSPFKIVRRSNIRSLIQPWVFQKWMRSCNSKRFWNRSPWVLQASKWQENVGKGDLIIFLDNLLAELLHLNQSDDQFEVERVIETLVRRENDVSVRKVIFKSSDMKDKDRIPKAS